jgi:hypothetical protein
VHHQQEVVEPTSAETPAPAIESPPVEPPKPAAISLWHKIFGLPAEQAAQQEEAAPIIDRPAVPFEAYARQSPHEKYEESTAIDPSALDSEVSDGTGLYSESSATADSDATPTDSRRPRRRRRGRGGRGRRADGDREERRPSDRPRRETARAARRDSTGRDDHVHDAIDEEEDEDDEFEPSSQDSDEALVEENGDISDSDDQSSTRGKSALQRSIPSWDEAIGCIIDSNMQGRSQRRPSSHPGGRSNSPRGRTRGRRRR